jgi:peptidoglycan/LPS O-acetylase OafA/YrhL
LALRGYRPEVDGLRAVAVLGVVLFHYRIAGFAGGYVGVDVFFVISGFLITGIIEKQVSAGKFSFRQFYLRRVRRILPMLFVTIFASMAPAATFLSPRALKDFGASAVAATLSSSNILFFRKVGYFDTEAALKPLKLTGRWVSKNNST